MENNGLPIDSIIEKLGYKESDNYIEFGNIDNCDILSIRLKKILKEINPHSVFIAQEKPFILFFGKESEKFKNIHTLIWNAQIPVAIFCGKRDIKIYNGCSIDKSTKLLSEIEKFELNNNDSNYPFSYWDITSQLFWEKYSNEYNKKRLNEVLLRNIQDLTNILKSNHIDFATKLVLRIIFIRFLIDRHVDLDYENFSSDIEKSKKELANVLKDKEKTYNLFKYLKNKFHGNLFDDLEVEKADNALIDSIFDLLSEFVEGKSRLSNGQFSLFELYDFNIIPVELISNIYEILLGEEERKKYNAFYTPNYLVEYILNKTITPYLKEHKECRVLDPSCGSGAFLANSYRQIIENNLEEKKLYIDDDKTLKSLLLNNIYGVDINDKAVDVTIFSLYLTMLDYKNPKTLSGFELPELKGRNILSEDFFDKAKLSDLEKKDFDFIIGNPPWGSVKDSLHMKYCIDNKLNKCQQNHDICRSFVFRVKDFKHKQCCLIIHSTLFYMGKTHSINFRKYLLSNTKIKEIIEMSAIRDIIFEYTTAPAAVIVFKYVNESSEKNKICHTSLKPNIFAKLFNAVVIEKTDIKYIEQDMLLKNDWAWKTVVFGFSGDFDNIKQLKEKYKTIRENNKENNFSAKRGIETNDGDLKDASHLIGLPFINPNNDIHHFYITDDTTTFTKNKIHRPHDRDKNLFKPPHCVIKQGINLSNYKMLSAYNDKEIIFTSHAYIIKGTYDSQDILFNLVGLFNSKVFSYLNLMLSSFLGIEREKVLVKEIFEFSYIYDDEIVKLTKELHNLSAKHKAEEPLLFKMRNIEEEIESKWRELDDVILEKFGLKDNVFVDYALNVQIPQLRDKKRDSSHIYRSVTEDNFRIYANVFYNYFSPIYKKSDKYVQITIYINVKGYSVFEFSVYDEEIGENIKFSNNLNEDIELITRLMLYKINDMFYQVPDTVYFRESSIYIIKPNYYKNWHPAVAQLDLADVIDSLLSDEEDENNEEI